MDATQAFTKLEVKKLCDKYLSSLVTAREELARHFEHIKKTDNWWQKLLHNRDEEQQFVYQALEHLIYDTRKLQEFVSAESGTVVPSTITLTYDTYRQLTKSHVEVIHYLLNKV